MIPVLYAFHFEAAIGYIFRDLKASAAYMFFEMKAFFALIKPFFQNLKLTYFETFSQHLESSLGYPATARSVWFIGTSFSHSISGSKPKIVINPWGILGPLKGQP